MLLPLPPLLVLYVEVVVGLSVVQPRGRRPRLVAVRRSNPRRRQRRPPGDTETTAGMSATACDGALIAPLLLLLPSPPLGVKGGQGPLRAVPEPRLAGG